MTQDLHVLVERARRGERAAFGQLVKLHQQRAYATAYRMMGNHDDAADVAQEAFVRAFRALSGFDGRADFFTWLYRIVINVALNHLRSGRRRRTVSFEDVVLPAELQAEAGGDPRRILELKRVVGDVGTALDELSETLKATVVLVLLEGMPYRDAAAILECSEGTVAWRVHEGRRLLRERLGEHLRAVLDEGDGTTSEPAAPGKTRRSTG